MAPGISLESTYFCKASFAKVVPESLTQLVSHCLTQQQPAIKKDNAANKIIFFIFYSLGWFHSFRYAVLKYVTHNIHTDAQPRKHPHVNIRTPTVMQAISPYSQIHLKDFQRFSPLGCTSNFMGSAQILLWQYSTTFWRKLLTYTSNLSVLCNFYLCEYIMENAQPLEKVGEYYT